MAGLCLSSRPPVHPAFNPTFHYVLSSSSSALRLPLAVRCTTFRPGAESERQKELELKRKQIFQDGFSMLPQMWSKEDMRHARNPSVLLGSQQERLLEQFIAWRPLSVLGQRQLVHGPGLHCTDLSTSPEPWWRHSWRAKRVIAENACYRAVNCELSQVDGLECDDPQLLQTLPWIATLVVSLSDREMNQRCGGIAVFPRSHWLIHDWISNVASQEQPFPKPFHVPAASPIELELGRGDAALLHPWLARTIAPNVSSTPTNILILHLGRQELSSHKLRIDESEYMWRGWNSMTQYETQGGSEEVTELNDMQEEEAKALIGGWQGTMARMTPKLWTRKPSLLKAHVAPRDLLAWHLRTSATQAMEDGNWSEALSMLQRLIGLHPKCYRTALQAGQCCIRSAPAGQLAGRAGRKCMLEDGERFLLQAIEIAPGWPLAYAELTKCLLLMGRGRELEIAEVVNLMKQRCDVANLCLRYPAEAASLQRSLNTCEGALSSLAE